MFALLIIVVLSFSPTATLGWLSLKLNQDLDNPDFYESLTFHTDLQPNPIAVEVSLNLESEEKTRAARSQDVVSVLNLYITGMVQVRLYIQPN